ncbi:ABC transporter permease [Cohnella sp. JJ-181]|uniref:ABC transporter permease n=1 Tax=Cohnella rhizoplanae TaxID=2974897 RepID=UPI0022FF930C|nr:ABC transporter permease [Cohnella sp. JJ-181]CAI6085197.1 Linearmycin resistance permease protein LnrM [Cohnella sp. JJ-181]
MNTLHIAKKEIVTALRNKSTFIFMLAFPIALMLILGLALSNAFSGSVEIDDIKMAYKIDQASPALAAGWQSFADAAEESGVTIEALPPGQDGKQAVKEAQYAAYAEVSDQGIDFYDNSRSTIESNILQGMLTSFADRYNLVAAYANAGASSPASDAGQTSVQLVKTSSLTPDSKPNSMDYYAIAMTTMIALYAALSSASLIESERSRHTIVRLSAAPVSKTEIFAGKVLGGTVINAIFIVAVMLLSHFAFGANWGDHPGHVLLVLLTEVVMAVGFGLAAGMIFRNKASQSFLLIFIQIASFVGGAYFPVDDFGGFIGAISYYSPLRWNNSGVMQTVFGGDTSAALWAACYNLAGAAVLLAICMFLIRRRETI